MTGGFQIIDELGFLHPTQVGHRLEFNNHGIETYEIGPIHRHELLILVEDRQANFALVGDTAYVEFESQGILIHSL